jgi:hypothetical protein
MAMTVLICGSPADGFQIVGLFADRGDAESYAEDHSLKDWWVARLISPEALLAGKAPVTQKRIHLRSTAGGHLRKYRRIFARAAGSSFACSSSSRAKRQQAAGVPSIAHRRNAASSLGLSTSSSAARSTTAISIMDQSASKPIANDPRPLHHCAHFAERYLTRKVPQPAVRSSHKNSTACRLVSAHQHWRVGPMF